MVHNDHVCLGGGDRITERASTIERSDHEGPSPHWHVFLFAKTPKMRETYQRCTESCPERSEKLIGALEASEIRSVILPSDAIVDGWSIMVYGPFGKRSEAVTFEVELINEALAGL